MGAMSDPRDTKPSAPDGCASIPIPRAPLWRRVAAFALDWALLAPFLLVVGWLWVSAFQISAPRRSLPLLDWLVQLGRGDDPLVTGGLLVGLMIWALYQLAFHLLFSTTPGLALLGLRLVDERAAPIGPVHGLTRVAGATLSTVFFLLGHLWIVFDAERQGFHDKVSGTRVTHGRPSADG